MAALKPGILLNQISPKLHRANKRPLYIVVLGVVIVFGLLVWAWILRSHMKTQAQLRAAATTEASPATNGLKAVSKQWTQTKAITAPTTQLQPPAPLALVDHSPLGARPVSYRSSESSQHSLKEQLDAEEVAAMESPLHANRQGQGQMSTDSGAVPDLSPLSPAHHETEPAAGSSEEAESEYLKQNLQSSKKNFAGVEKESHSPILAGTGEQPPFLIRAGWDIPAILEQTANSDLPGELRARVRENVYDSEAGKFLLIPQNSILVGRYNSDVAYAQNRIQVNWDRLERPNGPTIYLNQMNGIDADGSGGLSGITNNHLKRLIGFALLSSAFSAGIEISQNRNNSAFTYPSTGQLVGQAVGQQMGQFGARITDRNLNRPPTIQLPPGTRFNVRVDRDMVFAEAVQD